MRMTNWCRVQLSFLGGCCTPITQRGGNPCDSEWRPDLERARGQPSHFTKSNALGVKRKSSLIYLRGGSRCGPEISFVKTKKWSRTLKQKDDQSRDLCISFDERSSWIWINCVKLHYCNKLESLWKSLLHNSAINCLLDLDPELATT